MAERVPARLTAREGRKFALVVGGAFVALGALLHWRGHPLGSRVASAAGGLLVAGGVLVPTRLGPVYRAWMRLALAISKVTTPVMMGAIYFLVITPAGLLLRLFGHRPLARGRAEATAWVSRDPDARRSDLTRQF